MPAAPTLIRIVPLLILPCTVGCASLAGPGPGRSSGGFKAVSIRFHVATAQETEGYLATADERGQPLFVAPQPFLTDADVWSADVFAGEHSQLVRLDFTEMGATALEWVTRRRVGHRLAVYVDDQLVMSPLLRAPLVGGKVYLDGGFSRSRAAQIAKALNEQRAARAPVQRRSTP
jgi:preprotein translocase subunit SecD